MLFNTLVDLLVDVDDVQTFMVYLIKLSSLNSSFRGLYQFIRFIDELIEKGKDFGEENVVGPNDNVVRMMTIHSSKGLEFPFVIYSGLSKDFNKRDLKQPVILNQRFVSEWIILMWIKKWHFHL